MSDNPNHSSGSPGPGQGGGPHESNKLRITFIVNGENVDVELNVHQPLHAAVAQALAQSHNTGRPPEDWDVRDSKGTYLDPARKIEDYRFPDGVRLFLSLRVGAGG